MSAKVHVHLHVSDLSKSRAFYEKFFGVSPVKVKPGYVKFLPPLGPVNLALSDGGPGGGTGTPVDHLGIQVESPEAVRAALARARAAGVPTREEMGVDCCHANQDKFWVQDPDGVEWEVYHLNYDLGEEAVAVPDAGPARLPLATGAACCGGAASGADTGAHAAARPVATAPAGVAIEPARPEDLPAVLALLTEAALPREGVGGELADFVVARLGGRVVGVVGMERYGRSALFRSLVVAHGQRRQGLGRALTERLLEAARARGVTRVFVLTETAAPFAAALGFSRIARDEADPAVRESAEFRALCPQSAACMRLDL